MPSTRPPVAVITGGGGEGIGAGICQVLASRGYLVWVLDVDGSRAQAVAAAISSGGSGAHAIRVDVSDPADVAAAAAKIAGLCDSIDVLVNSAGVGCRGDVADASDDDFDRVMGINLRGAWLITRALMPALTAGDGGAIVNIGSVHALGAERGNGLYAATKAGLVALTRATARDYGDRGVRCNIIHPGAVPSPQNDELHVGGDAEPWLRPFLRSRQMLKRVILPEDIGRAVAFLAGTDARCITGIELCVDAGLSSLLWDTEPVPE